MRWRPAQKTRLQANILSVSKCCAREILKTVREHAHIVFDADAAKRPKPVYSVMVDHRGARCAFKVFQKHVDYVGAWLDRQYLIDLEDAGEPKIGMSARPVDRIATLILHESTDIMHLYAEEVAEARREKRGGNIVFDKRIGTTRRQADSDQQIGNLAVREQMQIFVVDAGFDFAHELEL